MDSHLYAVLRMDGSFCLNQDESSIDRRYVAGFLVCTYVKGASGVVRLRAESLFYNLIINIHLHAELLTIAAFLLFTDASYHARTPSPLERCFALCRLLGRLQLSVVAEDAAQQWMVAGRPACQIATLRCRLADESASNAPTRPTRD